MSEGGPSFWKDEELPAEACRRHLLRLWLGGGLIILAFIYYRATLGHYGVDDSEQAKDVWKWFVERISPTACMMIGAVVAYDLRRRGADAKARAKMEAERSSGFLFRLSWGLCALQLAFLLSLIIYHPYSGLQMKDLLSRMDALAESLRSLGVAILAAFFIKS